MPNPYSQTLLDGNLALRQGAVNAAARLAGSNTRGEQIIAEYKSRRRQQHDNTPFNMQTLMECLHDQLDGDGWHWAPGSGSYVDGGQLLDRTGPNTGMNAGQCEVVAGALYALTICPDPFGCGIGGLDTARNTVKVFNNRQRGFISGHNIGGVLNLLPNIQGQNGNLTAYYMWEDHKVVLYNHRYYDPCYNQIYDDLADMSAILLTGYTSHLDGDRLDIAYTTPNGNVIYVDCSEKDYLTERSYNFRHIISGPWRAPYNADAAYPMPQVRTLQQARDAA